MAIDPKPYLEYLDKEMTIMGILSVFSVAVATVPAEQILSGKSELLTRIFRVGESHVIAGAALALLAAYFFYLQRSHLAWYYGQIALAQSLAASSSYKVQTWLMWADGWDTWTRYQTGFIVLSLSIASYVYAVAETLIPSLESLSTIWSMNLPLAISGLVAAGRWYCLARYPQDENPFQAWLKSLTPRGPGCYVGEKKSDASYATAKEQRGGS